MIRFIISIAARALARLGDLQHGEAAHHLGSECEGYTTPLWRGYARAENSRNTSGLTLIICGLLSQIPKLLALCWILVSKKS